MAVPNKPPAPLLEIITDIIKMLSRPDSSHNFFHGNKKNQSLYENYIEHHQDGISDQISVSQSDAASSMFTSEQIRGNNKKQADK